MVAFYSVVQSVFGVGLLVFGTPTLLLLGYSFESALVYLLPCSIVISLVQVLHGWKEITVLRRDIPLYTLPFVAVGLVLVLTVGKRFNIKFLVGLIMIMIGLARISKGSQNFIQRFFSKHVRPCLVVTGLIHGTTNLGGGPLTITVNSVLSGKEAVRANIAYGYLMMALVQILLILFLKRDVASIYMVILPALSLITYLLFGHRIFKASTQVVYYHLMTVLIFIFGLCLAVF